MVSPPRFQPEVHCGAATSCRLPSAWSALGWYGTQLLCPPLRHKHVHVTYPTQHLRYYTHCRLPHYDILITAGVIACRIFSPPLGSHTHTHHIISPLYFAFNQGNDRRSEFTEASAWRGDTPSAFIGGNTSSHIQVRSVSLLTF